MKLQNCIDDYLEYCKSQKRLDSKTLKAYRIDLTQFAEKICPDDIDEITPAVIEEYISGLHQSYKPKSVKRKIASVKALFHYLEFRDIIPISPFNKVLIKFREPVTLPKTIPLDIVELFLKTIYDDYHSATTVYHREKALQSIAISELLFSTGIRISELCQLKASAIDLSSGKLLIEGKGSKERRLQIGNSDVIQILKEYKQTFADRIRNSGFFFPGPSGTAISDQSVRRMIKKYVDLAEIDVKITPHRFRHTFSTALLDAGVDIRYIQKMLGHSSISVTEIYTHVSTEKQRDILTNKHPRKDFDVGQE